MRHAQVLIGVGMKHLVKLLESIQSLCVVDTVCKYIFWAGLLTHNVLCYDTDTAEFQFSVAMLVIDTALFICYMYGKHTYGFRKAFVWFLSIIVLPVAAVYIVFRLVSRGLAMLTAFVMMCCPKPRDGGNWNNPVVRFLEWVYDNEPC